MSLTGIIQSAQRHARQRDLLSAAEQYGAIYADPPWRFDTYGDKGRGRSPDGENISAALPLLGVEEERGELNHYTTMPLDEICALPVGAHAARHCALFMWATFNMMPEALQVGAAWGFKFKTARVWAKLNPNGWNDTRSIENNFSIGTGYIARGNPEPLLIFTRGEPAWRDPPRALIIAPRREHSRKPDGIREEIVAQVDGPYLELFARQQFSGWDCWGSETTRFNAVGHAR